MTTTMPDFQIKEEAFNQLFAKRVVHYPVSKDGQTVNAYLSIKDLRLQKHFNQLKAKYGFKRSEHDLQSEYIFQAWNAIMRFELDDEEEWEELVRDRLSHPANKLISYIKTTNTHKLYEFANPNAFRTTTSKNGKIIHYTLVLEFESLDKLLTEEPELSNSNPAQLTDENNLFNSSMYVYYVTFFQKWFAEQRDMILTKSQVDFLDKLRLCAKDSHLTKEEYEEVTGTAWADYSRRIKKIQERIERAWVKQKPLKESRKKVFENHIKEYLEEYIHILENDSSLLAQNLQLTNHLLKGMYDKRLEYEVFLLTNEVLKGERLIEFNRLVQKKNHLNASLSASSLYVISEAIEERLEQFDLSSNGEELGQPKVVNKRKKKERKHTEVITKNKEGKIVGRDLKLVKPHRNNIYFILPTGATYQKEEV